MSNPQQPIVRISPPPSNGLGVAGFIVSLVGLVLSCGLLCPIGTLLSFIALFKRPRGFAIAGFILGLTGMAIDLAIFLIWGVAVLGMCAVLSSGGSFSDGITRLEMQTCAKTLDDYRSLHGLYPDDTTGQAMADRFNDGWGHKIFYHRNVDGSDYELRSPGPDGMPGNGDDRVRNHAGPTSWPIPAR